MSSRSRTHSSSKASDRGNTSEDYGRDEDVQWHDPCAATASFFVFAQRNVIKVLHHDTLAIEHKFEQHQEDVRFIAADNVSEKGGGRQVASYDTGQTVIVWDLFTGQEIARFASFEVIHTAAWMRDGNIAFGNAQGNIILFEPSTEEHSSTRTMFDPITSIAPAADCKTFAIGYKNGSILVAALQPNFTILHTLTTSRVPSPITGLAWHGSSSKQKTDMLATQNSVGELRVWSISKTAYGEQPRIIRALQQPEIQSSTKNWFSWSKNGRIVVHSNGDTRAWDVRTKKMGNEIIPTIDNVIAIAGYGPNATFFTVGQNYTVQQYDLMSKDAPVMVANVQHVPPNAPPTPPDSIDDQKLPRTVPMRLISAEPNFRHVQPINEPAEMEPETSEDEGPVLSPLQKLVQEMDDWEEEGRDKLAPLSPVSSRASLSSASSYGRPLRRRGDSGRGSPSYSARSDGTTFSQQSSIRGGHESISIRTGSSVASSRHASVASRKDIMRSPDESKQMKLLDLFPFTKARLSDVKFRAPSYPSSDVTADVLRVEMLSVVFGWPHDIEALIRDEQSRLKPGSASCVLLSKWLGDSGADAMASMVASESMTSADWMLLALTVNMGHGPQRQIGEAFVKRSLEANEIHAAVAILLGLGSQNEAIEVYVSRKFYLEAVLLTCLIFPHDWQRQSHLVRKWGEQAVAEGQPELAVRCFSCTGIEPSEPWFSPRSQDMVYQAQRQALGPDSSLSPNSPPSAGASRMTLKNAGLKLTTSFGERGAPLHQESAQLGVTPIANSALTPGPNTWKSHEEPKTARGTSQTRTATPSGYQKARLPSVPRRSTPAEEAGVSNARRSKRPTTASSDADGPTTAIQQTRADNCLPSPNPVGFYEAERRSRSRAESRDRNTHHLHIQPVQTVEVELGHSPATTASVASRGRGHRRSTSGYSRSKTESLAPGDEITSPQSATTASTKGFKGRSIDRYIESLEEANFHSQHPRGESRQRDTSRDGRSRSRPGHRSKSRNASDVVYVNASKRSPSSPKSMTAEDASKYSTARELEAEPDETATSPLNSMSTRVRASSRTSNARTRAESPDARPVGQSSGRSTSRNASRPGHKEHVRVAEQAEPLREEEGEMQRTGRHSPPSPAPMEANPVTRSRQRSSSRRATETRARSTSRRPLEHSIVENADPTSPGGVSEYAGGARPRAYSTKEQAAKELEQRRLSLARRTPIPQPGESYGRTGPSPHSYQDDERLQSKVGQDNYFAIPRSRTVDPNSMQRGVHDTAGTSTSSVPIGLPATPRAMRHPRYIGSEKDTGDTIPEVPSLPENLPTLQPLSYQPGAKETDDIGPLLPSTVYSQRPSIARSVSTPPENYTASRTATRSPGRVDLSRAQSHYRQASEREFISSHQSVLDNAELPNIGSRLSQTSRTSTGEEIIIVGKEDDEAPPILAELAHLAGPPPPPPPPTMYQPPPSSNNLPSGVISIAIDGKDGRTSRNSPLTEDQPSFAASSYTRSRHGSLDGSSVSLKAASSKWQKVADRMRSGSKSRNAVAKSPTDAPPQQDKSALTSNDFTLPATSFARAKSPYETVVDKEGVPVPPPTALSTIDNVSDGPSLLSSSVYRHPREVRANMPPESLQQGVYQARSNSVDVIEGGMI